MQLLQSESDQTKKNDKKQFPTDCFLFFKGSSFVVVGSIVATVIFLYGYGGIYGFSAFPDEFGYWSPAASFLGYDWSKVTALGSYYSYGYSILLIPFLLFSKDPIITYRAAILFNLVLQCVGAFVLCGIMRFLYSDSSRISRGLSTVIAMLYPAWIFYTQTTMSEPLLYFLLVFSIFLSMKFFQKPSILRATSFVVVLLFMYTVHMRCIGIMAAGGLTIFIWMLVTRNDKKLVGCLSIIVTLVILFAITFIIKNRVIEVLYHSTSGDMLSWNDYSGITYRIKKIMSFEGICLLLKDICGKVLYIGCSTYGIAYIGIYVCIKKVYSGLISKRYDESFYVWLFLLLTVLFQFLIALVFLNGASSADADRLDNFLHGRYIDFFLPLLICIGIEELFEIRKKDLSSVCIIAIAIFLITAIVSYYVLRTNNSGFQDAHGFTMIGMSYFLPRQLTNVTVYFLKEIVLSLSLAIVTICAIVLYRCHDLTVLLMPIIIIQIVLGITTINNYIIPNQAYIYGDILMGKELNRMRKLYPDKEVLHVYEGEAQYIELVQFTDREADIQTINSKMQNVLVNECFDGSDILLIACDSDYVDLANEGYSKRTGLGHFYLYYNP